MAPQKTKSSLNLKETTGRPYQTKKQGPVDSTPRRERSPLYTTACDAPPHLSPATPLRPPGGDSPLLPWVHFFPFLPQKGLQALAELDPRGDYKVELVPPQPARLVLTRTDRGRDSRPPPRWPAAPAWVPRPTATRDSTQQTEPAGGGAQSVALQTDVEVPETPTPAGLSCLHAIHLEPPGSGLKAPADMTPFWKRSTHGGSNARPAFLPSSVSTPNHNVSKTTDTAGPSGLSKSCTHHQFRSALQNNAETQSSSM